MTRRALRVQHIDPVLIVAVIKVESNGCERLGDQPITSAAGAMGLMQLLPGTWRAYRERLKLGDDPYNPADNIMAGTAYLHDLTQALGLFDGLAAYFAGPTTISERQLAHALSSSATVNYEHDVLEFVVKETNQQTASSPVAHRASSSLFAVESSKNERDGIARRDVDRALSAINHARRFRKPRDADASEPVK